MFAGSIWLLHGEHATRVYALNEFLTLSIFLSAPLILTLLCSLFKAGMLHHYFCLAVLYKMCKHVIVLGLFFFAFKPTAATLTSV